MLNLLPDNMIRRSGQCGLSMASLAVRKLDRETSGAGPERMISGGRPGCKVGADVPILVE